MVPGYQIYRRDRVKFKEGGVMVYIKNSIQCEEINLANCDLECIGLKMILSPQMFFSLIVIYSPPSSNIDFYEKLQNMLANCNFDKEVIIMGDFNVNWEDRSVRKKLKQITDRFDLTQVIKGPTRVTQSTKTQIDLVFSNRPERMTKSLNMITGISDHNLVLVVRKLTKKRFGVPTVKDQESFRIPNKDQEHFKNTDNNFNWDSLLTGKDVHEGSRTLSSKLQCIIKKFTCRYTQRNRRSSHPWINADVLKKMKEHDPALKRAIKTNRPHDKHNFAMLRNAVTSMLRKSRANFF